MNLLECFILWNMNFDFFANELTWIQKMLNWLQLKGEVPETDSIALDTVQTCVKRTFPTYFDSSVPPWNFLPLALFSQLLCSGSHCSPGEIAYLLFPSNFWFSDVHWYLPFPTIQFLELICMPLIRTCGSSQTAPLQWVMYNGLGVTVSYDRIALDSSLFMWAGTCLLRGR